MYLNKAYIIGNLTRDPEVKSLPTGTKVTSFSLATNSYWTDKQSGEKKEATEYHNIVVFGRQADACGQYLKKGQSALVEGRIQTRSWDDKETGAKKYRTEIIADRVQFGSKTGGGETATVAGAATPSATVDTIEYPDDDINPEDIPF